jgi:hypothetical protein
MKLSSFPARRLVPSVLLASALGLSATLPALAASVTQTVSAGILSANVANGGMSAITVSHADQTSTGILTLNADDSTGSAAGWNVTVQGSPFTYAGVYTNVPISAANFSLTSGAQPTLIAGQVVDATAATGPEVPPAGAVGTLDQARKVVQATAAYGSGSYTQALNVALIVPADSKPGTYTGTLTTTIASAP